MEYCFRNMDIEDFIKISDIRKHSVSHMTASAPQAIYTWQNLMKLQIAFGNESVFVKKGQNSWFYPIGVEEEKREFIKEVSQNPNAKFIYMTEEDVKEMEVWFPDEFVFSRREEDAEYLYDTKELLEHQGKNYLGFRRKLNKVQSIHRFSKREIEPKDIQRLIDLTIQWGKEKQNLGDMEPALQALRVYEQFGYRGILLEEEGELAAFIIGYENTPEMFTMSMMKKAPELEMEVNMMCIYSFLEELRDYPIINMEEDMGIKGLREMKQSMHPCGLLGSYEAVKRI